MAREQFMMKQGFITFVLSAVFLIAILAVAMRMANSDPDNSYVKYRIVQMQEIAIKQAFYDSTKKAAADAYAAAIAAGEDPEAPVEAAVYDNMVDLQAALIGSSKGNFVFWCGSVDLASRIKASEDMGSHGSSGNVISLGQRGAAACANSLLADVKLRRITIINLGFSSYLPNFGIGYATVFPSSYEVYF